MTGRRREGEGFSPEPDEYDETVVVRRGASSGVEDGTVLVPRVDPDVDDSTISAARPAADHLDDETVAAPERRRSRSRSRAPESRRERRGTRSETSGGAAPWSPGLPHVYGPRDPRQGLGHADADAVLQRIGPPPAEDEPEVPGRPLMPSMARRTRRARAVTIAAYAATVVLSALGLWGVARLAFGF